ncbi:chitin synthase [Fusarium bulbicola]|nr:chitin synthase [Fusarium bulbicola]
MFSKIRRGTSMMYLWETSWRELFKTTKGRLMKALAPHCSLPPSHTSLPLPRHLSPSSRRTLPLSQASLLLENSPHQRDLIIPRPKLSDPVARRQDSGSVYSVEDVSVQAVDYTATATQTSPRNSILEENSAPATKIEIDSESQNLDEYPRKYGQRKVTRQKHIMTAFLISVNFMFIFASWWWPRYYYVYIPFISLPLVLNCIMIASIICFTLKNLISAEKIIEPDHLEDLIIVMPCYNETLEECTKSLDSLVDQVGIDNHKRGIMVICDGRVRGPGMEKTTAQYLNEDIFFEQLRQEKITRAYRAWDGQAMDVEISWGYYKGVPFYCIVKEQNQGKRDSLIVIRSVLYKFNIRNTNPTTIFSSQFLLSMTDWLTQEVKVNQVDHLIGMDADTVFDKGCISELLKESKYPNTVGVCGYVAVDFKDGNWNLWSIYQNAEYTIAQGLRRLHQSIATKKVSCLPGCCQLLKICGMTCGDKVLVELFGYYPRPLDGMITRIRATASEDRNHIFMVFAVFNMDSFGWGKTGKVIAETPEDQVQEKQRSEGSSSGSNSPQLNRASGQVDETAAGVTVRRPTVVYMPPIAQLR